MKNLNLNNNMCILKTVSMRGERTWNLKKYKNY
jgi:hypothetical protein